MMKGKEFQAFKDYLKDQLDNEKDPVKNVGEDFLEIWYDLPKAVQMRYLEKYKDEEESKDEHDDDNDQTQNKKAKQKNTKGGRGRKSQQPKIEMKEVEQDKSKNRTRKQYETHDELDELDFKKMKITSRDSVAPKKNSRITQFDNGTLVIQRAFRLEIYIKYYEDRLEEKQQSD